MARFVQPPKDQLTRLRRPMTAGEQKVFEFFDTKLDQDWEIYIEPHLNGLRPDFVLLHPNAGIAVYEVKDWDLNAVAYHVERTAGGSSVLKGTKDGKTFSVDDPVAKVRRYKQEIHEIYCPRLEKQLGMAAITSGVIFPFAEEERLEVLLGPSHRSHHNNYHPLVGREGLASGDLLRVFPEGSRRSSRHMSPALAADLRNWLVEPDFASLQRTPLTLNSSQESLATTRTQTGYRRIKGPAGSGKSMVLAARAAELASQGKEVLVVTYNITLLHLLMDMAVRRNVINRGKTREKITWLNFHYWCKRTCQQARREGDYRRLWARHPNEEGFRESEGHDSILAHDLPRLVDSVIEDDAEGLIPRYDAIIIDEGQDYLPEWWNVLRKVLKPGGEMLLAADATQDVYGTANLWTEQAMNGAGFHGEWAKLSDSYRMPPLLANHARDYARRFLPREGVDVPSADQAKQMALTGMGECKLQWVRTERADAVNRCVDEILSMPRNADPTTLSIADITFLCDSSQFGLEVAELLRAKGVKAVHTFSAEERESRKLKLAFFMGDARVKATTLHSFKGWETRALVLYISRANNSKALAAIYAGMTRLKWHGEGSYLTVVCSAKELEDYGRTWSTPT